MNFNTVYPTPFLCPFCKEPIESGVGFALGALKRKSYRVGDNLDWDGDLIRPSARPVSCNFDTLGYFNCDNLRCSTWSDCFPDVQRALIIIRDNVITSVRICQELPEMEEFAILLQE